MKTLLFLIAITICFPVMGQVHKSVTIWAPLGRESLSANYVGGDSVYISLNGQAAGFTHIVNIITVFYGTPHEFYSWCNQLQKFSQENTPDPKTDFYIEINGQRIYIIKYMGAKVLRIFEKGSAAAAHELTSAYLLKIQNKFTEWADKNNIEYK